MHFTTYKKYVFIIIIFFLYNSTIHSQIGDFEWGVYIKKNKNRLKYTFCDTTLNTNFLIIDYFDCFFSIDSKEYQFKSDPSLFYITDSLLNSLENSEMYFETKEGELRSLGDLLSLPCYWVEKIMGNRFVESSFRVFTFSCFDMTDEYYDRFVDVEKLIKCYGGQKIRFHYVYIPKKEHQDLIAVPLKKQIFVSNWIYVPLEEK